MEDTMLFFFPALAIVRIIYKVKDRAWNATENWCIISKLNNKCIKRSWALNGSII